MPPPQPNTKSPTMVDDPNLAVFNTPVDCVVAAASFFNKMKITGHPGCDTAVKLVNKALELQENMSANSGKIYSRSHISEKAESAPHRHLEEGNGGPNTARHCGRDELAASSNVVPLQPIPRLAPNDARHTINDNQAQHRSNASAPDLRGHLNNRLSA